MKIEDAKKLLLSKYSDDSNVVGGVVNNEAIVLYLAAGKLGYPLMFEGHFVEIKVTGVIKQFT
jgi:hypothetical protein